MNFERAPRIAVAWGVMHRLVRPAAPVLSQHGTSDFSLRDCPTRPWPRTVTNCRRRAHRRVSALRSLGPHLPRRRTCAAAGSGEFSSIRHSRCQSDQFTHLPSRVGTGCPDGCTTAEKVTGRDLPGAGALSSELHSYESVSGAHKVRRLFRSFQPQTIDDTNGLASRWKPELPVDIGIYATETAGNRVSMQSEAIRAPSGE